MLRILTITLFSLALVHMGVGVPQRMRRQTATFKVTRPEILTEKMKQYLGPSVKNDILVKTHDPKWPRSLPKEFDLRKEFPECADQLSKAVDEGACDTDAPSIVSSILSDKYCIQTGGEEKKQLSADFLMGCAERCKDSAYIAMSWIYTEWGIPTGGDYGSSVGCQPYSYKPCRHTLGKYLGMEKKVSTDQLGLGKNDELEECKYAYSKVKQNKCTSKCTNKNYHSKTIQNDTMISVEDWYFLPENNEAAMKSEIMARGPIAVGFTLYDDFFEYKSGIYHVREGATEATLWKHAKVIGWGEENGEKYWLAVNTWSDFNGGNQIVKFGIDDACIQEYVTSGHLFEDVHPDDD
nr:PREDICTED: cathepsin B-like cysteine proteinase 4 [Bemisia tabaci]XP_018898716.1 PREDICTED: cathepsin B-like cysteine proteinase 4 [Bemisia tabaci]